MNCQKINLQAAAQHANYHMTRPSLASFAESGLGTRLGLKHILFNAHPKIALQAV